MSATRCKVCSNPTIRAQVARMVEEGLSDDAVSRALRSVGVDIGKSSILRHRQNHSDADIDLDEVELPEDMDVPRPVHVEQGPAMGDDAARLLATVRDRVVNERGDILQDRMVRETLLQQILESQLAITATALDRYQKGDGRYPVDMVKATAATWALFEKTTLNTMVGNESKSFLFQSEIERLEEVVFNEARSLTRQGNPASKDPPAHYLKGKELDYMGKTKTKNFHFCGHVMDGDRFNDRMRKAWNEGIEEGLLEREETAT